MKKFQLFNGPIFKAMTIGIFAIALGLSGLGVEGQANMGSYNFQGSERLTAQTATETPMITILRPASFSSSDTRLRTQQPLGLSEKKRLGVLLLFLGVAAGEAA